MARCLSLCVRFNPSMLLLFGIIMLKNKAAANQTFAPVSQNNKHLANRKWTRDSHS